MNGDIEQVSLHKNNLYEILESSTGYLINFNGGSLSTFPLRLNALARLRKVKDLEQELKMLYPAIWQEMGSRKIPSWRIYLSLKNAYSKSNLEVQTGLVEAPGWR